MIKPAYKKIPSPCLLVKLHFFFLIISLPMTPPLPMIPHLAAAAAVQVLLC